MFHPAGMGRKFGAGEMGAQGIVVPTRTRACRASCGRHQEKRGSGAGDVSARLQPLDSVQLLAREWRAVEPGKDDGDASACLHAPFHASGLLHARHVAAQASKGGINRRERIGNIGRDNGRPVETGDRRGGIDCTSYAADRRRDHPWALASAPDRPARDTLPAGASPLAVRHPAGSGPSSRAHRRYPPSSRPALRHRRVRPVRPAHRHGGGHS